MQSVHSTVSEPSPLAATAGGSACGQLRVTIQPGHASSHPEWVAGALKPSSSQLMTRQTVILGELAGGVRELRHSCPCHSQTGDGTLARAWQLKARCLCHYPDRVSHCRLLVITLQEWCQRSYSHALPPTLPPPAPATSRHHCQAWGCGPCSLLREGEMCCPVTSGCLAHLDA